MQLPSTFPSCCPAASGTDEVVLSQPPEPPRGHLCHQYSTTVPSHSRLHDKPPHLPFSHSLTSTTHPPSSQALLLGAVPAVRCRAVPCLCSCKSPDWKHLMESTRAMSPEQKHPIVSTHETFPDW